MTMVAFSWALTSVLLVTGVSTFSVDFANVIPNEVSDGSVKPPDPELMFCASLAIGVETCVTQFSLPFCNGTTSLLQKCTDKYLSVLSKCKVPLMSRFIQSKANTYKTSDDVLCKTKLYTFFESNLNCWQLGKSGLIAISSLTKGFLTKDGCKTSRMNNDILVGYGYSYPKCADNLNTYLTGVFAKSPCA